MRIRPAALAPALCMVLALAGCGSPEPEARGNAGSPAVADDADLPVAPPPGGVSVLAWSDYLPQPVIAELRRSTGRVAVVDPYDDAGTAEAVLSRAGDAHDVAIIPAELLGPAISRGELRALPPAARRPATHFQTGLMSALAAQDPGNAYALPYLHGPVGVLFDTTRVANPGAGGSLTLLFGPAADAAASCGIGLENDAGRVLAYALWHAGLDPRKRGASQLAAVVPRVSRLLSRARVLDRPALLQAIEDGSVCVALVSSVDADLLRRLLPADRSQRLRFDVPREGAVLWADVLVVPRRARDVQAAGVVLSALTEAGPAGQVVRELQQSPGISAPYGSPVDPRPAGDRWVLMPGAAAADADARAIAAAWQQAGGRVRAR